VLGHRAEVGGAQRGVGDPRGALEEVRAGALGAGPREGQVAGGEGLPETSIGWEVAVRTDSAGPGPSRPAGRVANRMFGDA
jgi:hypothetical protein